jgi:APA family basic amino acid/polyamine antiporter
MPIEVSPELCPIGTLFALITVCTKLIVLRYIRSEIPRRFKTSLLPVLPVVGIPACAPLMANLPGTGWERFVTWLILGLLIDFAYRRGNSRLIPSA